MPPGAPKDRSMERFALARDELKKMTKMTKKLKNYALRRYMLLRGLRRHGMRSAASS